MLHTEVFGITISSDICTSYWYTLIPVEYNNIIPLVSNKATTLGCLLVTAAFMVSDIAWGEVVKVHWGNHRNAVHIAIPINFAGHFHKILILLDYNISRKLWWFFFRLNWSFIYGFPCSEQPSYAHKTDEHYYWTQVHVTPVSSLALNIQSKSPINCFRKHTFIS